MASAGFLPVKRVTSPFRAETTEGPRGRRPSSSRISKAYWCPNSRSARVRFNLSTIAWSRLIPTLSRRMFVLCFSISLVTAPMNSRPGSTYKRCGLFICPRLKIFLTAPSTSAVFLGRGFSLFETAGHIDDGQRVFVCFPARATPHSVVWKEKKVCLVNCVWRGHIEFGARNVFLHRKINLPKGLAYQPFFASFSELFYSSSLKGCSKISKVSRPSYINLRFEI